METFFQVIRPKEELPVFESLYEGNVTLEELSRFGDLPKLSPKILNKANDVFPVGVLSAFKSMKAPVKYTPVKGVRCIGGDLIFPDDFDGSIQVDVSIFLIQAQHQVFNY